MTGTTTPKKPTRARREPPGVKPTKPYPEFPLFPHATGRWAKKIRGKFVFFGPWEDPEGALDRYLAEKDELHAGRVPRGRVARVSQTPGVGTTSGRVSGLAADGLSLRDLANHFLTAKQRRVDSGEMTARSFSDYFGTVGRFVEAIGRTRLLDDIEPGDFARHRANLAKTRGPVSLGNEIGRILRGTPRRVSGTRMAPKIPSSSGTKTLLSMRGGVQTTVGSQPHRGTAKCECGTRRE